MFSAMGIKAGMLESRDPRKFVKRLNHQAKRHEPIRRHDADGEPVEYIWRRYESAEGTK